MADSKRACLVYVTATQTARFPVRAELEGAGYSVCEAKADPDDAVAAQAGEHGLPSDLAACIREADLCVFLLPEAAEADGLVGDAAVLSQKLAKRTIGVVAGGRSQYPYALDDGAGAVVRQGSGRLKAAIGGEEVWEGPSGALLPERAIKHVRCQ